MKQESSFQQEGLARSSCEIQVKGSGLSLFQMKLESKDEVGL